MHARATIAGLASWVVGMAILLDTSAARAEDDGPPALVARMCGEDVQARYDAYRALLEKHPPEALPLIAKALPGAPLGAQSYGVSLIAGYPPAQGKPVWERWLAADAPYLRLVAGLTLAKAGDARGIAAAVEMLERKDLETDVLALALSHAYGLKDVAIQRAMRRLVRADAPPAVLGPVLYHLQTTDDREARGLAEAVVAGGAAPVRAIAGAFLWRMGDDANGAALAAALAAPEMTYDAFVRLNPLLQNGPRLPDAVLAALHAIVDEGRDGWYLPLLIEPLGRGGYGKAAKTLERLLDSDAPMVAKAAFDALSKLPGGLTPDAVRAVLAGPDEGRRVAAAEALRRGDDLAGLPAVVDVLQHGKTARVEAARVLGTFRVRAAVGPLLDALLDADLSVRATAQTSLQQVLVALFPYRRFDLATAGYASSATPDANRPAVERLRTWWAGAKDGDW